MKRCPTCQKTYPDDAPGFCSNDGTRLVSEVAEEFDPQKTILSTAPPPASAPPPQQYSPPSPEPVNPPQPPLSQPQPYGAPPPPPPLQQQQAWPSPPPPPPAQPQQQPWQAPPQQPPPAQNYGGGFYPPQAQAPAWPPQYPIGAAQSKGLSLITLILGLISAIGLTLLFLVAGGVLEPYYYLILFSFWGSAALGVIALILGILALVSKRQRSKWMAIVGLCLGLPAIAFCIYALITQPVILWST